MSDAPSSRPLRVVFDTNVVLSAVLFRSGRLSPLRLAWQAGVCVPVVHKESLQEFANVLSYPKFKLSPAERADALSMYLPFVETHTHTHQLQPHSIDLQCRDPKDQKFLDLASSARVSFLVSGDDDLLVLSQVCLQYERFHIIKPQDFIEFLAINPPF